MIKQTELLTWHQLIFIQFAKKTSWIPMDLRLRCSTYQASIVTIFFFFFFQIVKIYGSV